MQRIRDEAHRFANSYNSLLLRRRMRESLLDDCPGMTAGRKVILMKHFGSVAELRRADVALIARCRGIPQAFAQSLHDWLHRGG